MKYGLDDTSIKKIHDIFAAFPQVEKAILYGSKVKGNFMRGSAIDLTLKGEEIDGSIMDQIWLKLVDLDLIYTFGLTVLSQIKDDDLLKQIDREGIVFYSRWKKYKVVDKVSLKYLRILLN